MAPKRDSSSSPGRMVRFRRVAFALARSVSPWETAWTGVFRRGSLAMGLLADCSDRHYAFIFLSGKYSLGND